MNCGKVAIEEGLCSSPPLVSPLMHIFGAQEHDSGIVLPGPNQLSTECPSASLLELQCAYSIKTNPRERRGAALEVDRGGEKILSGAHILVFCLAF